MTATACPLVALNDGGSIPVVGLGVYQTEPGESTKHAVLTALRMGYRHVDTAAFYRNEADVGQAVRESGIPRSEIFVTSKVWTATKAPNGDGKAFALNAVKESLKRLGLEYIDLMLLHSPHHPSERVGRFLGLVEAKKQGLVKHIGVSNYGIHHLRELFQATDVRPCVNQIEVHVFLARTELVEFCQAHNIVVEAYSPLAKATVLKHPALVELAAKYNKTPAQIMLRYLLQRNLVILPKSVTPARIQANIDLFGFELSSETMHILLALDEGKTTGWDPTVDP